MTEILRINCPYREQLRGDHSQDWMEKNASILGNGRFWPISVYSVKWSTTLEKNGSFPTWAPTCSTENEESELAHEGDPARERRP
eukprot:3513363-Pleurochrysis_carterae.AAC.1